MFGPRVWARRIVKPALAQLIVSPEDNLCVALRGGVVTHRCGERALGRTAFARGHGMTAGYLRLLTHHSRHLALELVDFFRQGRLPCTPGLRSELLLSAPTHHPLRGADAPVLEHGQGVLAVDLARAHAHAQSGVVPAPPFDAWRVGKLAVAQLVVLSEYDLAVALRGGVESHRRREVALGLAQAARRDRVGAGRVRASAHGRGEGAARRGPLAHGGGVDARGGAPVTHGDGAISRGSGVGAECRGIEARGSSHVPHRCGDLGGRDRVSSESGGCLA